MKNGVIETAEDMQKVRQIEALQKKLDIAVNCLNYIVANYSGRCIVDILNALKEIDLVGTSAKEEEHV